MPKVDNYYHGRGLGAYLFWNDEPITIDEFDNICAAYQSDTILKFRKKKFKVLEMKEEILIINKISLIGKMMEIIQ